MPRTDPKTEAEAASVRSRTGVNRMMGVKRINSPFDVEVRAEVKADGRVARSHTISVACWISSGRSRNAEGRGRIGNGRLRCSGKANLMGRGRARHSARTKRLPEAAREPIEPW